MAIELEVRSKSQQALGELSAIDSALAKISKKVAAVDSQLTKVRAEKAVKELGNVSSKLTNIGASQADKKLESTAKAATSAAAALSKIGTNNNLATTSKDASSLSKSLDNVDTSLTNVAKQDAGLKKINDQLANLNKSAKSTSNAISGLVIAAGGIASAFAATGMFRFADSITNLNTKIKLVTDSTVAAKRAFNDISEIAFSTRTSLDATASLYNRIAKNSAQFQASQREVALVTQTVGKAIAISGSSAQEAESAIMQLGQALSSGRLQGDELRSISENASGLASAIAEGMDVSIGRLREMGEAGELTATKVFDALLKQAGKVNGAFDNVGITFAQAFTNMNNAVKLLGVALGNIFSGLDLPRIINSWAISLGKFAKTLDWKFNILEARFLILITNIKEDLASITFDAVKLDLESFLPSFSTVTGFFDKFTKTIANMFKWLYDVVIGHSYWTDMITNIAKTSSGLLSGPLNSIKKFGTEVSNVFKGSFEEIGRMTKEADAYFKKKKAYDKEQEDIEVASQDFKGYAKGKYFDRSGDSDMFDKMLTQNARQYLEAGKLDNVSVKTQNTDQLEVYIKRALDLKKYAESQPDSDKNKELINSIDYDLKVLQSALVKEINKMYYVQSMQLESYKDQEKIQQDAVSAMGEIMSSGQLLARRDEFAKLGSILDKSRQEQNEIQNRYVKTIGKYNTTVRGDSDRRASEKSSLDQQATSAFSFAEIDLRKHIIGFESVFKMVTWFVTSINNAFKWLYDQVIGHSWWPDLINGIQTWAGALLGVPLGLVIKFIDLALNGFKTMALTVLKIFTNLKANLGAVFSKGSFLENMKVIFTYFGDLTSNVNSFKTALDAVYKLATDFVSLFKTPIEALDSTKDKESLSGIKFKKVQKGYIDPMIASLNKFFDPLIIKIKAFLAPIEAFFQPFVIAFKQAGGFANKKEGIIPGMTYKGGAVGVDTEAYVGAGPQRKSPMRMIGHDFLNALPESSQVPVFAAISTGLVLLINKLFGNFVPTTVLTQISTTIAAVVGVNIINDSTLKKAQNSITDWVLNTVNFITGFLFGSMKDSVTGMKDPLSILTTLAKLSLAFDSARKAILETAINIAKAFPAGGAAITGYGITKAADSLVLKRQEANLSSVNAQLPAAQQLATATRDANARAQAGLLAGSVMPQSAADAARAMTAAADAANKLATEQARLTASVSGLQTKMTDASKAFSEAAKKTRESIASGLANAGGMVGGTYGFAAGERIADKEGVSGTSKLALQVGAAAIGAAIGGAFMSVITSSLGAIMTALGALFLPMLAPIFLAIKVAFVGIFATGAAMLGVPVAALVAGIAALGAIAYGIWKNWDEIWPAIKGISKLVYDGIVAAWDWISGKFNAAIDFVKKVFNAGFPEGLFIFMDQIKAWSDGFWKAMSEFFTVANFTSMGQAIWNGILTGLKSIAGWFTGIFKKMGDGIKGATSYVLDIFVPSAAAAEMPKKGAVAGTSGDVGTQVTDAVKETSIKISDGVDGMVSSLTQQERLLTFLETLMKSEHSNSDATSGSAFNRIVGSGGYFDDESKHPNKVGFIDKQGRKSTAAGAFQITGTTYNDIAPKLGVSDFSAQSQTEVATALIKRAGALDDVLAGRFEIAIDKLKNVWTSLPGNTDPTQSQRKWDTIKQFMQEAAVNVVNGTAVIQKKLEEGANSLVDTVKGVGTRAVKKAAAVKDSAAEKFNNYSGGGNQFTPAGTSTPIATIKDKIENAVSLVASFEELNSALASANLPTLTEEDFKGLLDTPEVLDMITTSLSLMEQETDKLAVASDFAKNRISKNIGKLKGNIKDALPKNAEEEGAKTLQPTAFGKTFTENFKKEFNEGLVSAMQGKSSFKEVAQKMWETLSTQFLQQMTTSFMDNLLKGFYTMLDDFAGKGDAAFIKMGEKARTGIGSLFTSTKEEKPVTDISRPLSEVGQTSGQSKVGGVATEAFGQSKPGLSMAERLTGAGAAGTGGECVVKQAEAICGGKGGFMEALTGLGTTPGSEQSKMLAEQTAGMDDLNVEGFFETVSASFKTGFDGIISGAQDFGGSIMKVFESFDMGGLIDGVIEGAKMLFNVIKSFFADGGYVQAFAGGGAIRAFAGGGNTGKINGPGTGRSDSILARVSNGEYIVNAKSTALNRGLLDAINFGQAIVPGYANGGVINMGQELMNQKKNEPTPNSSTVNIAITGDISRQTRAEIIRMMPQITSGTRQIAYENGSR